MKPHLLLPVLLALAIPLASRRRPIAGGSTEEQVAYRSPAAEANCANLSFG
ncbi:MAG: hypothetical protein WC076_06825 [Terrimicrobiaceae bacterium]|nr:hypothetical protein [Terrimicrobiaceae bacterium]